MVVRRYVEEAVREPRLLESERDDALLNWGVPEDWLDTVRQGAEDTILDIIGQFPDQAPAAVLSAAVGEAPTVRIVDETTPTFAHSDAQRRFQVVGYQEALAVALDTPSAASRDGVPAASRGMSRGRPRVRTGPGRCARSG